MSKSKKKEFISVNKFATDELLGCSDIMQNSSDFHAMVEHIRMRIALYTNNDHSFDVLDKIEIESENVDINKNEYIINELQYEERKCKADDNVEENELRIFNDWTQALIYRYDVDFALDFYNELKKNRSMRVV